VCSGQHNIIRRVLDVSFVYIPPGSQHVLASVVNNMS